MMPEYFYSLDGEGFSELGERESYEAVFEEVKKDLDLKPGQCVWIGKKSPVDIDTLVPEDIATWLLGDITDKAVDNFGEIAEDWPQMREADVAMMDAILRTVIISWLKAKSPRRISGRSRTSSGL